MRFRAEHKIRGVSVADYESLYFDEDFNQQLCEHVKLARELLRREEKDGHLHREVRVGPEREIPAPVAKILGASRIEYTECVDYQLGIVKGRVHAEQLTVVTNVPVLIQVRACSQ